MFRLTLLLVGFVLGCSVGSTQPNPPDPSDPWPAPSGSVRPCSEELQSAPFTLEPPEEPSNVVWGIIGTGQSLSVGARANTATYPTEVADALPGRHFVLRNLQGAADSGGPFPFTSPVATWRIDSLSEPLREVSSALEWPFNVSSQSPHTPMADELDKLSKGALRTAHVVVGQTGYGMEGIRKGGSIPSYAGSLLEVEKLRSLLAERGLTLKVAAVLLTHGETDHGSASYASDIVTLQRDYETDLKRVTGQTEAVPLFLTHPSAAWINPPEGVYNTTTDDMTSTWLANPGKVRLVGSKTNLEYVSGDFHLSARGTVALGRLYAQHVYPWVKNHTFRDPLYPVTVARSGNVVSIRTNRPLVDDKGWFGTTHSKGPWSAGMGFEAHSIDGTPIQITSAEVSGAQVTLTCATPPYEVSHAMYVDGPSPLVRRVRLRDSAGEWLIQFRRVLP